MDSIYGNSIKPNKQKTMYFLRKMGRGIPREIGFGSPDACECFRYAPDAGSADILQNPEVVISTRNGFRTNNVFYYIKTTNRKEGNDRKDHEKISCVHQHLIL